MGLGFGEGSFVSIGINSCLRCGMAHDELPGGNFYVPVTS